MKDRSEEPTLRDLFACFALEGMIANKGFQDRGARGRAADAYMAADGMLEARKSSEEILIERRAQEISDKEIEKAEKKKEELIAHQRKVELLRKVFNRRGGIGRGG